MVKNKVKKMNPNHLPVRSGAWIVSLSLQLLALVIIALVSYNYGAIGIATAFALIIGFVFIIKATVKVVNGTTANQESISALGILHLILVVIAVLIIAGFSSILSYLPF